MSRTRSMKLIATLALAVAVSACTRSLPLVYAPGVDAEIPAIAPGTTVAVARLEDKRLFIEPLGGVEKAGGFIATQGAWKFGLTHEGREYVPISQLIQELLVAELNAAGIQAVALDAPMGAGGTSPALPAGGIDGNPYVLGGSVTNFEFANHDRFIRIDSERAAALDLSLLKSDGSVIFANQSFADRKTESEGMGVLHSTNVDKLVNVAFKSVAKQLITKVGTGVAGSGRTFAAVSPPPASPAAAKEPIQPSSSDTDAARRQAMAEIRVEQEIQEFAKAYSRQLQLRNLDKLKEFYAPNYLHSGKRLLQAQQFWDSCGMSHYAASACNFVIDKSEIDAGGERALVHGRMEAFYGGPQTVTNMVMVRQDGRWLLLGNQK